MKVDDGEASGGLRIVPATEEERAAIRAMLSRRAECAPAGAGVGRASAWAWAGFRLAAIVLLAAGVEVGLGDGDEFDDAGCSVAQRPGGTSRGKTDTLKAESRNGGGGPHESQEGGGANLSLAAKVFELLTALDPDNHLRKAPPIKVFNLYYRQGLGAAEIARKCNCDRSLIYDRLAAIQEKIPWTPEQLRQVSPHVEAMQDAVGDSRARRIYRKGAAYGDEEDGEE